MRSDLKGPKHEIFEHRVFPHIRTVPVGDLGIIGQKMKKFLAWALYLPFYRKKKTVLSLLADSSIKMNVLAGMAIFKQKP
jgi:hypothetical protein